MPPPPRRSTKSPPPRINAASTCTLPPTLRRKQDTDLGLYSRLNPQLYSASPDSAICQQFAKCVPCDYEQWSQVSLPDAASKCHHSHTNTNIFAASRFINLPGFSFPPISNFKVTESNANYASGVLLSVLPPEQTPIKSRERYRTPAIECAKRQRR